MSILNQGLLMYTHAPNTHLWVKNPMGLFHSLIYPFVEEFLLSSQNYEEPVCEIPLNLVCTLMLHLPEAREERIDSKQREFWVGGVRHRCRRSL